MLGLSDADSAENNPQAKTIVITPVACALGKQEANAPKLSGTVDNIRLRPGSRLESIYQKSVISEEFFCNYEVNAEFEWAMVEAGVLVSARGAQLEIRAIESATHQFFIATLFQPQLSSKPGAPHPLIVAFLRTAEEWKARKLDDQVLE